MDAVILLRGHYSYVEAKPSHTIKIQMIINHYCFIQESLTSNNYEKFVSLVTGEITTTLEKSVLKCSFNRVCIDCNITFISICATCHFQTDIFNTE